MKGRVIALAVLLGGAAFAQPAAAQTDRDGQQRWINIENRSPATIREFYMTDVDTSGWGDDRLGADVVAPGQSYRALPSQRQRARGYCQFDFRIVWENEASWERRRVNLCQATAIVCTRVGACGVQ